MDAAVREVSLQSCQRSRPRRNRHRARVVDDREVAGTSSPPADGRPYVHLAVVVVACRDQAAGTGGTPAPPHRARRYGGWHHHVMTYGHAVHKELREPSRALRRAIPEVY